jgi:hypothetical protein
MRSANFKFLSSYFNGELIITFLQTQSEIEFSVFGFHQISFSLSPILRVVSLHFIPVLNIGMFNGNLNNEEPNQLILIKECEFIAESVISTI